MIKTQAEQIGKFKSIILTGPYLTTKICQNLHNVFRFGA